MRRGLGRGSVVKDILRVLAVFGLAAVVAGCGWGGGRGLGYSCEADHEFTLEELWPAVEKSARRYCFSPEILAAIICQESSFHNFIVHDDGTGHGLLGLDDPGLLPEFEAWVREVKGGQGTYYVGRGEGARSIPVEWQIEFAAMTLARYSRDVGGDYAAARAWHSGVAGRESVDAWQYECLIRKHVARLFGSGPDRPVTSGTRVSS